MNASSQLKDQRLPRTAVAAALIASSATAFAALPPFTLAPAAAALSGASFTADNLLISDYSTVTFNGTTFTDVGYLSVSAAQLGGVTFTPAGLNSSYGLYIAFSGTGTTTTGSLSTTPTFGSFTSLSYTLYGYNGSATFDFAGNTPVETASGEVVLATGSLKSGGVVTVPSGDGSTFTPSANANLNFAAASGGSGFFAAPNPFYSTASTAFTNTISEVEPFSNGFRIRQGGGSVNFASVVPEPSTYALLFAGLAAVGFVARSRRR